MEARVKEMLLVCRPSEGDGLLPFTELPDILKKLGFDFVQGVEMVRLKEKLKDVGGEMFHEDQLITYLTQTYVNELSSMKNIVDALKVFDYDKDGKLTVDEFEYFMKNFGEDETYMDQKKMKQLLEMAKPYTDDGKVSIQTVANNLNLFWRIKS